MQGVSLQYLCRICMVLSFFCAACAVGLMWGLYPKEYDLGHVRACGVTAMPLQLCACPLVPAANSLHDDMSTELLAQVLTLSSFFYNAQRAGHLPPDNGVPWRSDALLWETTGPNGTDLTGEPSCLMHGAEALLGLQR